MSIDFTGGANMRGGAAYSPYDLSQYSNGAGINKGGVGFGSMTDMLQGNQSQLFGAHGNRINAGMSSPGGGQWSGGGNANPMIQSVLDQQMGLNAATKAQNQATWNEGKGLLYGARDSYNNSATANSARDLTNRFLANPEALNDRTQAAIQNKAAGSIDAQTAAQNQQVGGILAAQGQGDASSLAAAAESSGRANMAAKAGVQSDLEVQRARLRNQDFMNAMGQGRAQAAQDYGVQQGAATTFLNDMPQYKPDDLSGYAAIAGRGAGSGLASGAGLSSGTFQAGAPVSPGPMGFNNSANQMHRGGGNAFSGSMSSTPAPIDKTWGGNYGGSAMQYAGGGFGGQY